MKYLTPAVRRYIYGVCIVAVPVLVYFGVLDGSAVPVIAPLLLAIFNVPAEASELDESEYEGE